MTKLAKAHKKPVKLVFFLTCRSSVVQADGISARRPEEGGNVGFGADALWRAAKRRLPELPVYRSQPPGDGHPRVFQCQDPFC